MAGETFTTANPTAAGAIPAARAGSTGSVDWSARATARRAAAGRSSGPRFALPEPRLRQLMGVCGWAAVLGGVGLVVGIRALFGVLAGSVPAWYEPAITMLGGLGIALSVGAFLTVHRTRIPWVMLGLSSSSLVAAMVATSMAF